MRRRRPTTPSAARRVLAWLLASSLTTLALLVTGTTAAQAHDELAGSSPAAGGTTDSAPTHVELEFSGAVQELGTQVAVTGPDGTIVSDGPVQFSGTTVTQPLAADLPPGTYTVQWRATSADGHPFSDSYDFTIHGNPDDAAAPAEETDGAAAPQSRGTDVGEASAARPAESTSAVPWIAAGAVLVLLVAGGVALRQLRRRA